ncbi:hypothetical protein [Absidia glauca]|uniref:Pyrroline-5-carboxylate reductase n=1 Tax=Absidia glauca TaxID=4829 RepID=A0A168MFR9_ABSGL|nr:hypothetical protein [Absidia glauca]
MFARSSSSLHLLSPSRWLSYSTRLATQQPAITFIGAGNMAEALMGGLHTSGFQRLRYVEPLESRLLHLQQKYPDIMGVPASEEGHEKALHDADVVILAVKPHQLRQVMPVVSAASTTTDTRRSPLYISIVGGVTIGQMITWMGKRGSTPVIRCMPNTPALLGEGAFGLYANDAVDQDQRELTDRIMHAVAKTTQWVNKESLIDSNAGVEAGLTMEEAKSLTIQTCLGAARMAQQVEGDEDLASLRRKVTSPNGTTEAAIKTMEANSIRQIMKEAVFAATHRAHAISKELDQEQE